MLVADAGEVSARGLKEKNEDAVLLLHPRQPHLSAVIGVADGLGGHPDGHTASRLALDGVARSIPKPTRAAMVEAFARAEESVRSLASASSLPPATTLTVCALGRGRITIGHVGDSRAYLLRDGVLRRLTSDHSKLERMVAAGVLTEREALRHPAASALDRAIGVGTEQAPEVRSERLRDDDVILLTTDGIHGVLALEELRDVLMDAPRLHEACLRLAERALASGSTDDRTAVAHRYRRHGRA